MAKFRSKKISSAAFAIPLIVAGVVIAIVMIAASLNTDSRTRASDETRSCMEACGRLGGTNCQSTCTGIANGTIVCSQVTPQALSNLCTNNIRAKCDKKCDAVRREDSSPGNGYDPASGFGLCKATCRQVLGEGKTCQQVCNSLANGAEAKAACVKKCNDNFPPRPSPTATGSIAPTPTTGGQGGGDGFGQLNCANRCSGLGTQAGIACMNGCRDLNSGAKTCPDICEGLPSTYRTMCMQRLCPVE